MYISTGFGGLVGRVLVLHLCDSGSNPKVGSYFFFCLSLICDSRPVRDISIKKGRNGYQVKLNKRRLRPEKTSQDSLSEIHESVIKYVA